MESKKDYSMRDYEQKEMQDYANYLDAIAWLVIGAFRTLKEECPADRETLNNIGDFLFENIISIKKALEEQSL